VLDGSERRDPGYGPLSAGIVFDRDGKLRWIPFGQLADAVNDRAIRFAFQSYPLLLFKGRVPALATGSALDQTHRDARLILAQDAAGHLLILLTRFAGFGGMVARIPIGLTVPESIALIGALGAQHAVMLDGGISAQMLLRDRNGSARTWKGLRDVPLALVAFPLTP
jgi:exopolysaccharide biosynthesis protein